MNKNIKIIDYSPEYREDIIKLYMEAYKDMPEYGEPNLKGVKNYISWLERNGPFFKILLLNDKPIGFIVADAGWHIFGKNHIGEIHEIVIDVNHQGKGFGKLLMEKAFEYFKENNVNHIGLWVGKDNKQAIKFYKKLGFKITGKYKNWIRMEKLI